jgi:UDP:flavonoid glycosyltransferase YjiC (YdhE family)
MRILVTTNAAIGHFLPMAPTIAELVACGHEVRVGCPESFEPFVRRAGFAASACRETEVTAPNVPALPDGADERLSWAITRSWPADCRTWVDALLDTARQWRPDVMIAEPVEHAGRVVAAALGLPLVVHGWGFTLPAGTDELAAAGIADLYDRVSAAPTPPALVADLGPDGVQATDSPSVPRYTYRPFAVPGQPIPPPTSGKRRVLVTLGTYPSPSAATAIRAASSAALESGAEVIAVLGNADRGSREAFPRNVTVLEWVDMAAAVAGSDLIVHHGGAGTSWTALSHGKPAVVMPHGGDQFRNAAILSGAGVALVVSPHDAQNLSAAIARGLDDAELRTRATAVARENAAMPDIAALAKEISAFAAV